MNQTLLEYLDLGPLADLERRLVRTVPTMLVILTALGLVASLLVDPGAAGIGLALIAFLFAAGAWNASGKLGWLVPPLVRATEYMFIAVTAIRAEVAGGSVYALIAAVAYHHYDTVYRNRQLGAPPPRGLRLLLGGFETRMMAVWLAAVFDVAEVSVPLAAMYILALSVTESARAWVRAEAVSREEIEEEEIA